MRLALYLRICACFTEEQRKELRIQCWTNNDGEKEKVTETEKDENWQWKLVKRIKYLFTKEGDKEI